MIAYALRSKEQALLKKLVLAFLSFAVLVGFPTRSSCEAKCPWLNVATASGLLGGEAQMIVKSPVPMVEHPRSPMYEDATKRMDEADISCAFSHQETASASASTLLIRVNTFKDVAREYAQYLSNCAGSRMPLKGIGNEAVFCVSSMASAGPRMLLETVIGRVRNRAFVLTVNRPASLAAVASQDGVSDDTRNIAEQVAGSIF